MVKESRRPRHFSEAFSVNLKQLGAFGLEEHHFVLCKKRLRHCRKRQCQHNEKAMKGFFHYLRAFQLSRENSHSLNMGSMMM